MAALGLSLGVLSLQSQHLPSAMDEKMHALCWVFDLESAKEGLFRWEMSLLRSCGDKKRPY